MTLGDMFIGGNMHIDFTLTGTPDPTVKWYKNGEEILLGHRLQLDRKVGNQYSLLLPNIQVTDEGEYEFFAENAVGEAVCVLQLTPLPRPASPEYVPPVSHVTVKETTSFRRHQVSPASFYHYYTYKICLNWEKTNIEQLFCSNTFL